MFYWINFKGASSVAAAAVTRLLSRTNYLSLSPSKKSKFAFRDRTNIQVLISTHYFLCVALQGLLRCVAFWNHTQKERDTCEVEADMDCPRRGKKWNVFSQFQNFKNCCNDAVNGRPHTAPAAAALASPIGLSKHRIRNRFFSSRHDHCQNYRVQS